MPDLTPHPHDALFRLLVSNPADAATLLQERLPKKVVELIDPDRAPVHLEGTFVDGEGRKSHTDALFQVYLKGGEEAYIYALLEHKSKPDYSTAIQVIILC